jgi:DNA recombination-dependent growth factor C
MGARRYRIVGNTEEATREDLLVRLQEQVWREPRSATKGGENFGWVAFQNLCDTDLTANKVFFNQYFCFSLRMDTKRLPARLLRAMLDLRLQAWMRDRNRERVPAAVKKEIKEQLELELFPRQLPNVAAHNACWDMGRGIVWFFQNGNKANEVFRALFAKTFALETRPFAALQILAEAGREDWLAQVDGIGHGDYRPDALS